MGAKENKQQTNSIKHDELSRLMAEVARLRQHPLVAGIELILEDDILKMAERENKNLKSEVARD